MLNLDVISYVKENLKKESEKLREQKHFLSESVDWVNEELAKSFKYLENLEEKPWHNDFEKKVDKTCQKIQYLMNKLNLENKLNNDLEKQEKSLIIRKMLFNKKNKKIEEKQ